MFGVGRLLIEASRILLGELYGANLSFDTRVVVPGRRWIKPVMNAVELLA